MLYKQCPISQTQCLIRHHTMKKYWGMEVQLHAFSTSALEGSEWSASCPSRSTLREGPRYPLNGRLDGLKSRYE
jgi:hypothetical protein